MLLSVCRLRERGRMSKSVCACVSWLRIIEICSLLCDWTTALISRWNEYSILLLLLLLFTCEFCPRPFPTESGRVYTCHFSVNQAIYVWVVTRWVLTPSLSHWIRQSIYLSFLSEAGRVFAYQLSLSPFLNEAGRVFTCHFSPRPFFFFSFYWNRQGIYVSVLTPSFFVFPLKQAGYLRISCHPLLFPLKQAGYLRVSSHPVLFSMKQAGYLRVISRPVLFFYFYSHWSRQGIYVSVLTQPFSHWIRQGILLLLLLLLLRADITAIVDWA